MKKMFDQVYIFGLFTLKVKRLIIHAYSFIPAVFVKPKLYRQCQSRKTVQGNTLYKSLIEVTLHENMITTVT